MSDLKIGLLLDGVPQLVRALKLADTGTRDRTKAAIQRGTKAVLAGARTRIHNVSGELAATGRDEYSPDGLVGFVKFGYGKLPRRSRSSTVARQQRLAQKRRRAGTKAGKGTYGPVVERGDPRRHHLAHPFLIPALAIERTAIVTEIANATKEATEAVSA